MTAIEASPLPAAPIIRPGDVRRPIAGIDLWDFWPVQELDGRVATIGARELWMALSSPAVDDPALRHARARIRLLARDAADDWTDLGPALPDSIGPGSREWSGSAIVDAAHATLTLFFTAAGRRGEPSLTWEQRLFDVRARVAIVDGTPALEGWDRARQTVASDRMLYDAADQAAGTVGTIKAFRDPAFFRDPADGRAYIVFTASLGGSASVFNGAVGIARADDDQLSRWTLLPPLLGADTLNNELERPHILRYCHQYYLFWSTQASVFAPDGPRGPTGLYGMIAPALMGPYRPLNASGLVIANPREAPSQAYSWLVLDDLEVVSFVDLPGQADRDPVAARARFGGAPAPRLRLAIDGAKTTVAAV